MGVRPMYAISRAGCSGCSLRCTVNPELRRYAGLERDCVVIGAGSRVEVWDSASWERYSAEQEGPFADLSEEVLPGLI